MTGRHREKLGWFARRRLRLDAEARKRAEERIRNAWGRLEWEQAAFERARMAGDAAALSSGYPGRGEPVRQPEEGSPSEAWWSAQW